MPVRQQRQHPPPFRRRVMQHNRSRIRDRRKTPPSPPLRPPQSPPTSNRDPSSTQTPPPATPPAIPPAQQTCACRSPPVARQSPPATPLGVHSTTSASYSRSRSIISSDARFTAHAAASEHTRAATPHTPLASSPAASPPASSPRERAPESSRANCNRQRSSAPPSAAPPTSRETSASAARADRASASTSPPTLGSRVNPSILARKQAQPHPPEPLRRMKQPRPRENQIGNRAGPDTSGRKTALACFRSWFTTCDRSSSSTSGILIFTGQTS